MKLTQTAGRWPALLYAFALFTIMCCMATAARPAQLGGGNPTAQKMSRPLTNSDIIQMSEEEMPEHQILKWIETSENDFDVSPYGVIQLHDAGVSLRVIEAMQRATAGKRASPQQAAVNGRRSPEAARTQVQQAGAFTVALDGCNVTGTTVTCYFTVTNAGAERKLFAYAYGSKLIDSVGRRVVSRVIALTDVEGRSAEIVTFPNDSIKGWVRFTDAQATSRRNASLSLHFFSSPPGSFDVEFTDVRLDGAGEFAPLNLPPLERRPQDTTRDRTRSRPGQIEDTVKSGRRILDTMRGRRP